MAKNVTDYRKPVTVRQKAVTVDMPPLSKQAHLFLLQKDGLANYMINEN
ncbi:MAG TPA: hypothetical protein VI757_09410 [Bacteroidia bacterium]|nr:hypothetical protein [Bacteroidia bacterium]